MRSYLGIDPGLDGAIALIDPDGNALWVADTPSVPKPTAKGGTSRAYALAEMRSVLFCAKQDTEGSLLASLESVHAMKGQGVTSMFSMGDGFGTWKGLLAGLMIPFILVPPIRWKKQFGLQLPSLPAEPGQIRRGNPAAKELARVQAQQRWPTAELSRKKDHARADALFLAEYARLTHATAPTKGGTNGRALDYDPTDLRV